MKTRSGSSVSDGHSCAGSLSHFSPQSERGYCAVSRDTGWCEGLAARGLSGTHTSTVQTDLPCRCSDWRHRSRGQDPAEAECHPSHYHHSKPARYFLYKIVLYIHESEAEGMNQQRRPTSAPTDACLKDSWEQCHLQKELGT